MSIKMDEDSEEFEDTLDHVLFPQQSRSHVKLIIYLKDEVLGFGPQKSSKLIKRFVANG